jgi:topoisomerase-4 subunit A
MRNNDEKEGLLPVSGMYEDYFLDYASYVILERAVPAMEDGLKPVQRRILHSMKMMDDGRFHKVANVIGQTMQYHPHGDAAIRDALVNLGQKDLLIDTQGNWGDSRTGDSAAAPRYIEARLTKFALEVAFNNQTTEWQLAYDGRKKEPLNLPMKFPLLLAQGAEGIAVGLSTRILPHNFNELIDASINYLKGKTFKLYPDFPSGGVIDIEDYRQGKRGGKIKVRAKIEMIDNKTLHITEIPYGITTSSLIDSILKANDKGKIKIKHVVDNTAKNVEIKITLPSGTSPQLTIDALFAFTSCESNLYPNCCVIVEDKPHFLSVHDLLKLCTDQTKSLLNWELEIEKAELEEKWFFANLEKIFIEKRIYRDIEECETWEAVLEAIDLGLKKYVRTPSDPGNSKDIRLILSRDITEEDLIKLTEIKIKRISKFNSFKADERIAQLEEDLEKVKHYLAHLTQYTIDYFSNLKAKYGKDKTRKTEISSFEQIEAAQVVANNAKLYINRKEGFIGTSLKKDEFIADCSDIDDIIVFMKHGEFKIVRIDEKVFVGKNIIHAAVWQKGDERTTYNAAYLNGKTGVSYVKRFQVKAITRDKPYQLMSGDQNSKLLYFSVNPNGEAEIIKVFLTQGSRARKKIFNFDFAELDIKGRGSKGNQLTKYPVRKIELEEEGKSTLEAIDVWMDEVSGRLNTDERGIHIGSYNANDQILVIFKNGSYVVADFDLVKKFEAKQIERIEKFDPETVISVIYYEGEKEWTMVKRFQIETSSSDTAFDFLTEHKKTVLLYVTTNDPAIVSYKEDGEEHKLNLADFISIKGWRALGNKLSDKKIRKFSTVNQSITDQKLKPGDTITFD